MAAKSIHRAAIVLLALFVSPVLGQTPPAQTPPPLPSAAGGAASVGSSPVGGSAVSPSSNSNAIDPTKNVLDLVQAAIARQDDLRNAARELSYARLAAAEQLNELRYKQTQELATALANKLSDESKLRAEFSDRLAIAEAKRIDAIRAVDVNAVAVANERATATATALAKTVADSASVLSAQVTRQADDLRVLVKTTADEANRNQQLNQQAVQAQFATIGTRLAALEQAGAEGIGRQKFQNPNDERIARLVESLSQSQSRASGVDTGSTATWALVGTIIFLVLAIGGFFLNAMRSKPRR